MVNNLSLSNQGGLKNWTKHFLSWKPFEKKHNTLIRSSAQRYCEWQCVFGSAYELCVELSGRPECSCMSVPFTQEALYNPLQQNAFTPETWAYQQGFVTRNLLHQENRWQQKPFTPENLCTESLSHEKLTHQLLLPQKPFTLEDVYTINL